MKSSAVAPGPVAQPPGQDQLGVRADGRPRPHVTSLRRRVLGAGYVLCLGIDERPNLVGLDALAGQVPKRLVLVVRARLARIHQELGNRVAGYVRDPTSLAGCF